MLLLTVALAHAGYGSVALGVASGAGESSGESWSTTAPYASAAWNGRFLILEGFLGGSGSGLLARDGGDTVPAASLQAEAGFGLGVRAIGGGVFVSRGLQGPGGGLYGHLTLPGPRWAERLGAEVRIFDYPWSGTSGVALLFRVEPGHGGRDDKPEERDDDVHHGDPYAETTEALAPGR